MLIFNAYIEKKSNIDIIFTFSKLNPMLIHDL